MTSIWTREQYDTHLMSSLAGEIGASMAEEMGQAVGRRDLTRYHEASHAVACWILEHATSHTVVFPGGGGVNCVIHPLEPQEGMPADSSVLDDGPSDKTAVDVMLRWADEDGYSIDLEEMRGRTRDLLKKHWHAVVDYARHLLLNNDRIHAQFTARILERHLGPCKPQEGQ